MSQSLRVEQKKSRLAKLIASLPDGASSVLQTLDPEMNLSDFPRPCDFCGTVFTPKDWAGRFCSASCSARWSHQFPEYRSKLYTPEARRKAGDARRRWLASGDPKALREIDRLRSLRPSSRPDVQQRISAALKAAGHRPKVRGGNGCGPTKPQKMMADVLGYGWEIEHVIPVGKGKAAGWPTHYKIDLANVEILTAIEIDGGSHCALDRQEQDRRKDAFLGSIGWKVLRFSNQEVLDWIGSGTPTESSISMTLKLSGILPSA